MQAKHPLMSVQFRPGAPRTYVLLSALRFLPGTGFFSGVFSCVSVEVMKEPMPVKIRFIMLCSYARITQAMSIAPKRRYGSETHARHQIPKLTAYRGARRENHYPQAKAGYVPSAGRNRACECRMGQLRPENGKRLKNESGFDREPKSRQPERRRRYTDTSSRRVRERRPRSKQPDIWVTLNGAFIMRRWCNGKHICLPSRGYGFNSHTALQSGIRPGNYTDR